MTLPSIKNILVYTHNSIGLGHAYRTLAVITGIKKWRPDIDFLVVSGSSIPQIFFREGIEVVKLPSVKLDVDDSDYRLQPRYLKEADLEAVFDFRQKVIVDAFDFFDPDALIVEHNMTGLMSELIPVLMKKWMRKGGPKDFPLAHICRGIMSWTPQLRIPYQHPRHRSESIDFGTLYDFLYVLEDRNVVDVNREFLGADPRLEPTIRYLGKITNKPYDELPGREEALGRFGLTNEKIILVSLGRKKEVGALSLKVLESIKKAGLLSEYQVVMILDPYLASEQNRLLRTHPLSREVVFLPFVPDLVDLICHSDLVISRAGYNTFNEILLTGAKAVLIPERHGGGEQELRAQTILEENVRVVAEEEFLSSDPTGMMLDLINNSAKPPSAKFDKYSIGKAIIEDLEDWKPQPAVINGERLNEAL
jgi:predicted glycosyltransferase